MEKLSYKFEAFEGPLDLMLHLISKNKLNIYDIPIADLLDQYMAHIDYMRGENMDVESEFLEMAARLVYIKTVSLLPKHEEADQLKEELTGQLLEYQECKKAAVALAQSLSFVRITRLPMELKMDKTYQRHHTTYEIFCAYLAAAGKKKRKQPPSPAAFSGIVSRRIVSVSSRIIFVLRQLRKNEALRLDGLFENAQSKSEMVATFLAVLELVKAKRVYVGDGDDPFLKIRNGGGKRVGN